MGTPHGQPLIVERLDNLGGQERFELLAIRILDPEIAEYVAAATHDFQRILHRNISFNRFSRFLMRSISRFGVLMPVVIFDNVGQMRVKELGRSKRERSTRCWPR